MCEERQLKDRRGHEQKTSIKSGKETVATPSVAFPFGDAANDEVANTYQIAAAFEGEQMVEEALIEDHRAESDDDLSENTYSPFWVPAPPPLGMAEQFDLVWG